MEQSFFENYKTSELTNTRRVINTPSAFTQEHFFHIQEAGYLKSLRPHASRRSGLSSYLFLIVLSGSGEVSYCPPEGFVRMPGKNTPDADFANPKNRLSTVSANPGDCFFLDCSGEYMHISSADDPWELLWIHFNGPQAAAYYSYFLNRHDWHFRSSHLPLLIAAVQNIIRCHEEKTDDTDLLAAQQITNILTQICCEPDGQENPDSSLRDKLRSVARYLDENYAKNPSLDDLADMFYISKYYLSREFKKEFGTTIIQYLLTKKITNAKELLRYSNHPIEKIAELCGIDDASYFNKVFKKMEGCTASEYRKRW